MTTFTRRCVGAGAAVAAAAAFALPATGVAAAETEPDTGSLSGLSSAPEDGAEGEGIDISASVVGIAGLTSIAGIAGIGAALSGFELPPLPF